VAQVEHFIDHNENGLALEELLYAAAAEGALIDERAGAEIDLAATLMQAPAGLWQLSGEALSARLKESGLA